MTFQTLFDQEGAEPFSFFLEDLIVQSAEAVKPRERLTVSQAAEKYRKLNNVGSYTGDWQNSMTPYLVEPMDEITNRMYESVVFAGPAQCGKTDMFLNTLLYKIICDPGDISLVQTTQATGRDFSITRIDRMIGLHEELKSRLLVDNTFDKQFKSGMICRIQWPTVNELSGKTIPIMWLTDADRMPQDIDGEGTAFAMSKARTTTFGRNGKVIAESSPGFLISDPQWAKRTPHEAPPTPGILALFNAGDRRRWYWKCVSCENSFEPNWDLIRYPRTKDPIEAGELAHMFCPHCGQVYEHDPSRHGPGKMEMNQTRARWLKEGQLWLPNGTIAGEARRSNSASFALEGVCATFNSWKQLVTDFLNAEKEYEDTGKEETLKTVVNTKIGRAYLPKAQAAARLAEIIKSRAIEIGMRVVPAGVRFLIATIDVQGNRFEVQVHGVGIEDFWVIDRFAIRYSKRVDPEFPGQFLPLDPKRYPEDWRHILHEVMMKTYPLQGDPDRAMGIYQTFCDSGGSEGVTTNAYDFFRWLKRGYDVETRQDVKDMYPWYPGFVQRFLLVKGEPTPSAPRVRLGYPDAQRKDRMSAARGEIPVLFLNSTALKNHLDSVLDRDEPGGRVIFPNWLPLSFFKELTVETKNKEGRWENLTGRRNESWDLLVYFFGGLLHHTVHWEHIRWEEPPIWAAEWDANSMVFSLKSGEPLPIHEEKDPLASLAALGAEMI